MSEKQKTIQKESTLEGVGLHTGNMVKVVLKPAPVDSGISFVRVDLPEKPTIKADIAHIAVDGGLPRCTSIGNGRAVIHTAEHLMSVLCGFGIDNLIVELNGNELPGMDGSAMDYLSAVKRAGIKELENPKQCFEIKTPLWVEQNGSSIVVLPANNLEISYLLDYNHPSLHPQFYRVKVSEETFEKEIAPCRTFCLENEAEELRKNGLGKGANYKNTLVVGKNGVKENTLRFDNEFARHKILDFIGDLYLLGMPFKGHVFAIKSGHMLNIELLKKIAEQKKKFHLGNTGLDQQFSGAKELNINDIMRVLPHRFPFLFVDRIIALEKGKHAIGIKNVTINDNFFQGHFPSRPVMPGVLMVEAMAQTGGLAVLTDEQHLGQLAFFLAADNVKFRKVVSPGDQLYIKADVIKNKAKVAQVRAEVTVDGEVVAEADMTFSFVDADYLT